MAAQDKLYEMCRELADAVQAATALSPGGEIEGAFVSPGLPSFDCPPMIAVHVGGAQQADTVPLAPPLQPGERADVTGSVNLVAVTATIVRCVVALKKSAGRAILPSFAAQEADAKNTLGDVWVVWNHLATLKRDETLFGPIHRRMFFDPAVPLPISGESAGWQMQFRVQLDGYRTVT